MKRSILLILTVIFTLGSAAVPCVAHGEQRYTAQRRPRVTVMEFRDTNTSADETKYGSSVSAMLVTFLKRKSQFVVVERQDVQSVLAEWQRNQEGQTTQDLSSAEMELLERIDVIIQGSVTVLGNRIEIDGKLLSRKDGRIITAAQRSGPIDCLRQIVDRLGIALENSFLAPYYGQVQLTIYDPENVRFLLTPILTPNALDEEKPPGELEATIIPDDDQDTVEWWIAGPTTHTIKNVLAGWYTLRLTREGYEDVKIPNSLLRAVETSRGFEVRYHEERRMIPLKNAPEGDRLSQLLVRVDSLETKEIDLSKRGIRMRKKQGALEFTVLDESGGPLSDARIMMKSVALEINPEYQKALEEEWQALKAQAEGAEGDVTAEEAGGEAAAEGSEGEETVTDEEVDENEVFLKRALHQALGFVDKSLDREVKKDEAKEEAAACDYFKDKFPPVFDHGRRFVSRGESFDLAEFTGGDLDFEEYRGEPVPVGFYEIAVWAPRQELRKLAVLVSEDFVEGKSRNVKLERRRRDVLLVGRSKNKLRLRGTETRLEREFALNAETGVRSVSLPVDFYEMESDAEGLGVWRQRLDLRPLSEEPPSFDETFRKRSNSAAQPESVPAEVRVKSTIWVGGRFEKFRPFPHTFYNRRVGELLDELLVETSVYDWSSLDADDDKLAALAAHLRDVDLLILNEDDMSRIRVFPDLAEVIRGYVEDGHALLAFVTREGDYEHVLGKPMTLKRRFSDSDRVRLNLAAGHPKLDYDVELGWDRSLPKLRARKYAASPDWDVVSYTKGRRRPRVVESGSLGDGGYVMVWFETSTAEATWGSLKEEGSSGLKGVMVAIGRFFASGGSRMSYPPPPDSSKREDELPPGTDPRAKERQRRLAIEEEIRIGEAKWAARLSNDQISLAKTQLQGRALLWAEYLMYRRLDGDGGKAAEYRQKISQLESQ
jgi:TolB-like protein